MIKLFKWNLMVLLWSCLGVTQAIASVEATVVVSATKALESMLPPVTSFTIANAGTHTLTLSDLQGQSSADRAFSSLSVVIYQGSQLIRVLNLPSGVFTTTSPTFSLAAGQYQAQILGVTNGGAQYGIDLKNSSNVSVFSKSGAITAPSNNNFSSVQQTLALTTGQSYTVTLSDRLFPVALTSLQAAVTQGGNVVCTLTAVGVTATCNFMAVDGSNLLTILASEVMNSAGLYSVKVANTATGDIAYEASLPLGNLPKPIVVTLPANAAYMLNSIDFINQTALSSFKLLLVQGANVLVNQSAAGGYAFTGNAGMANLYLIATPASGSAGSYSVLIKRGTNTVFSQVDSVADTVNTGVEGYVFKITLPTAGNYTLQLRDFSFPQSFTTLSANASQEGTIIGTPLSAAGTMTINNAAVGELNIAVLTKPADVIAPALPTGLFGLSLAASGSSTPIFEKTQGVGGSFSSAVFTSVANTRYTLTATDFAAPVALDQLRILITRGSQQIASVFGGGTLGFDASEGDYTVSFLSNAKASPGYGIYGVSLAGVSLSSNASSVTSGSSVTLTWSADASGCVASGAWSGNKAASGSDSVGPLTANSTFTLTCSNGASSAVQSVNVTVTAAPTPASSGGGGGVLSIIWLLALVALANIKTKQNYKTMWVTLWVTLKMHIIKNTERY